MKVKGVAVIIDSTKHKLFLLELIEKNLDVLEEKKTDAKSSFQKQKV